MADIAAILGQSTAAATTTGAAKDQKTVAENFDQFLTLLTTQLKNQNPLEPLDTNEFTGQLVQFTSVEQAVKTNQNLENLITATAASSLANTVSYIGKTVEAAGETAALENGNANWNFDLKADAPQTFVSIQNAAGQTIFTQTIAATAGKNTFNWDGKLANGTASPDGPYKISVQAKDADGNAVNSTTTVNGVVSSIDMTGSEPLLTVNGAIVKLSDIKAVTQPSTL